MNPMFSVSYVTKLVDVRAVTMVGNLELRETDPEYGSLHWYTVEGKRADDVEEWLEKFLGKRVKITIEWLGAGADEAHLLDENEESDT